MSRNIGPKCRLCRREKVKLFLKGDRCYTGKCALEKKAYLPGQQGKKGKKITKLSEYGLRLREKQKVKRIYGMNEAQFKRFFSMAKRKPGITGEYLLKLLERRLDNTVYRSGFSASRAGARQLVLHGHILVNNKKVNISSYILKPNDVIEVKEKSKNLKAIKTNIEKVKERGGITYNWLEVNLDELKTVFKRAPEETETGLIVEKQLIVEFYKK
ncbi:MAG: 30S ribosomal protein S4 [Candidatus Firestonebacteria bacterium]